MPRQTQARQALEDHQVAIARAYERGRHLEDIAKKYDVSTMTVHNWLKTLGYKHSRGRGRYPKAMAGRARDLASRGWDVEKIGDLLKVRPEQVEAWVNSAPIENPKGFKRRSAKEKDTARKQKLEQLEKRRAKKKKKGRVPDPAKLEEVEQESQKAKRPRGRPRKEPVEEPYPPPRHRCNKHWTEPEERYVLELIAAGRKPKFIYERMRASKQRQRRIWRKYGNKGDPPNFPPPRTGRPPKGPAPTGAPAAPLPPPPEPEPPALPQSVVKALSDELADRAKAEAKLTQLRREREKLEKQAKLEAKQLKKLRTSKERREDILSALLGEKFGDALSNRVLEGSYEHKQLGLKPGSKKPLDLPTPEELAAAKTDKELKRLVGGAVRQLRHPANRKRLARLLLDATLEYQNWLGQDEGDLQERNEETAKRRKIVATVLREISAQYDLDEGLADQLTEDKTQEEKKKAERELKEKESQQAKRIEEAKKAIKEAEKRTATAQRKAIAPEKVPQMQIPTLAQFIEIGREQAASAFEAAPSGKEDEAIADAVTPLYEKAFEERRPKLDEVVPIDLRSKEESLEIDWTGAANEILSAYLDMPEPDLSDKTIVSEYDDLVGKIRAFNSEIRKALGQQPEAVEGPEKPKRKRRERLRPRPLQPADYYAQRFVHQQYAKNGKFYRFGPEWKNAYPEGSPEYKLFASASKKELKELSEVLEQRFGFPNRLMMKGKLPNWWVSKDKRVPQDVQQALTEAIASFPDILSRLRQRRDQLFRGRAKTELLKELKPQRPAKALKASDVENLEERLEKAREKVDNAVKLYESKVASIEDRLRREGRQWDEAEEERRKALYAPVERAQVELEDLQELASRAEQQREKEEDYRRKVAERQSELRKAEERKMLTEDISRWVGKLGQAVKAKEALRSSTDPSQAPELDAAFQTAISEYRKIWNAMSEPDRILLAKNLKFADLRGRPTDRGVRYAKYLMKKYDKDLKKNPGMSWMTFCKNHDLC